MSVIPEPLNPNIPNARRLARRFTPHTPFHHPHLDPNLKTEDLHLVPAALFPGRKLDWELPRPAVANLHVLLKLTTDPNELLKEFHDKIPQIDDILGLWGEMKGASPPMTGEAQLRARTSRPTEESEGTIFNLVSELDTPGRAGVIYLTDAVEDSEEHAEDPSVPSNLRTIDWLGFNGSYAHLEDAKPKTAALPTEQDFDSDELRSMKRSSSTPPNLRVTEWLDEQYTDLFSQTYSSEPDSNARKTSGKPGPYETFWEKHNPYGPKVALIIEKGESSSNTSQ